MNIRKYPKNRMKVEGFCKISGCDKKVYCRKMCSLHYHRDFDKRNPHRLVNKRMKYSMNKEYRERAKERAKKSYKQSEAGHKAFAFTNWRINNPEKFLLSQARSNMKRLKMNYPESYKQLLKEIKEQEGD